MSQAILELARVRLDRESQVERFLRDSRRRFELEACLVSSLQREGSP